MTVSFSSTGEPRKSKRPSHESHTTAESRAVILIISLPPFSNFERGREREREREHQNRCPLVHLCCCFSLLLGVGKSKPFPLEKGTGRKPKLYAKGNGGGREDAPMPGSVSMMSFWRRICWASCPIDRGEKSKKDDESRAIRI
jgi:hypothetical protein